MISEQGIGPFRLEIRRQLAIGGGTAERQAGLKGDHDTVCELEEIRLLHPAS